MFAAPLDPGRHLADLFKTYTQSVTPHSLHTNTLRTSRQSDNMRAAALILLFVCFVECRKLSLSINKHANMDFINMEIGGGRRPVLQMFQAPALEPAPKPVQGPAPTPAPAAPAPTTKAPVQASTANPAVTPQPAKPVQPMQPTPSPALIKPVPVNPAPVANTNTTTGPGSVKSLVNFYNAQGNSSLIRPYSYSQAVKQG